MAEKLSQQNPYENGQEKVIRRQLTIKPGMLLVPFELVQNEILLRRLDYIDDANMIVTEDPDNPAQVNVTLICKDQLSWVATVESNFLNSFDIGLENKNFMKLGHVLNMSSVTGEPKTKNGETSWNIR